MNDKKLVVVTLAGFAPASIGCYGSSWNSTPTIDQLAAGGCVWDRCLSRHADPIDNLRDWFGSGRSPAGDHFAQPNEPTETNWLEAWKQSGPIELITDSQDAINVATKCDFDQLYLIDPDDEDSTDVASQQPAQDIESTQFAQLIAAAVQRMADPEPWSLLWLHSDFLIHRWDAPRWLVQADEEDIDDEPVEHEDLQVESESQEDMLPPLPVAFDNVEPPLLAIQNDSHCDLVSTWMRTYGCQIRLIDELLAVLRQASSDPKPAMALAGTSGFALGQNDWIGHRAGALRSCHLQLPLIIDQGGPLHHPRLFDSAGIPDLLTQLQGRVDQQRLIDPDVWSQSDEPDDPVIVSRSGSDVTAVTSSRWFYVQQDDQQERLFLKPDDIHDANDVSRLRADVIDRLRTEAESARPC
ncbi:MAG: hypothetical protein HKN47_26205 [Pirellulaceae bacterium]|nr:hypothetical protein [Pirellulaceae bacterium]